MTDVGNAVRLALRTQCFAAAPPKAAPHVLLATLVALTFTYFSVLIVDTIKTYAERPAPEPHVAKDWRPPIDKCPKDIKLWDCIRNVEYIKHD